MYRGKYKDILLDGRWKVKGMYQTGTYTIENIYNNKTINISNRQLKKVMAGEETVSQIICRRIGNNTTYVDNRTIKNYKKQIRKYIKGE